MKKKRKTKKDKYISELLTEMLINPLQDHKKYTKSQKDLIDEQFRIAMKITDKYGGQIVFKLTPMKVAKQIKKTIKSLKDKKRKV